MPRPAGELEEETLNMPDAQFDWDYLNDHNVEEIRTNIRNRKHVGDVDRVVSTWYCFCCILVLFCIT